MARKKRELGLGDIVEAVTEATGIKQLMPEDCGCDKRKEQLNALLSFGKKIVNCPTSEQIEYLNNLNGSINLEQRKEISNIYYHVYQYEIDATSTCGDCWNNWISQIKRAV